MVPGGARDAKSVIANKSYNDHDGVGKMAETETEGGVKKKKKPKSKEEEE